MRLESNVFRNEDSIPEKYTCDGDNVNPPLEILEVPEKAVSLVLIMDDPDVPDWVRKDRLFVHWVITDMPPTTRYIPENSVPPGIVGKNTLGKCAYFGPCPPDREHRYFFKLYALDTMVSLGSTATKDQVEQAIDGHIIDQATLMGRYECQQK